MVSLPGILSDALHENENVLNLYINTDQNPSDAEHDALSIPIDGDGNRCAL